VTLPPSAIADAADGRTLAGNVVADVAFFSAPVGDGGSTGATAVDGGGCAFRVPDGATASPDAAAVAVAEAGAGNCTGGATDVADTGAGGNLLGGGLTTAAACSTDCGLFAHTVRGAAAADADDAGLVLVLPSAPVAASRPAADVPAVAVPFPPPSTLAAGPLLFAPAGALSLVPDRPADACSPDPAAPAAVVGDATPSLPACNGAAPLAVASDPVGAPGVTAGAGGRSGAALFALARTMEAYDIPPPVETGGSSSADR
jgi:hypothetical protein